MPKPSHHLTAHFIFSPKALFQINISLNSAAEGRAQSKFNSWINIVKLTNSDFSISRRGMEKEESFKRLLRILKK
jgi:hypothetical protein